MKAVVLKVRDGEAMVLLEDGTMKKIKCSANRGDEIEVPPEAGKSFPVVNGKARREKKKTSVPARKLLQTVVAAVLTVFLLTGAWSAMSVQACTYVTLDADMSVELVLNANNELIATEGLDQDGKIMADRLMKHGPRRLSFSEALSEAEEMLEEKGYLSSDQDILISIVTDTDDRYERLSQEAEEVASKKERGRLRYGHATPDDRRAARLEGISTGRYMHRHRPADMTTFDPSAPPPKPGEGPAPGDGPAPPENGQRPGPPPKPYEPSQNEELPQADEKEELNVFEKR